MEPKYHAFRRWLDILIIIWEYDWILRDHQQNKPKKTHLLKRISGSEISQCDVSDQKNGKTWSLPESTCLKNKNNSAPENERLGTWKSLHLKKKKNISKLTTNFLGFMLNFGGVETPVTKRKLESDPTFRYVRCAVFQFLGEHLFARLVFWKPRYWGFQGLSEISPKRLYPKVT